VEEVVDERAARLAVDLVARPVGPDDRERVALVGDLSKLDLHGQPAPSMTG